MKQVVQVKLLPSPEQYKALVSTLRVCNSAASWVAAEAYGYKARSFPALQKKLYHQVKEQFGLSAQPALLVLSKVAGSYKALKANLDADRYGKKGSPRRAKVESKPIEFREDGAQPFDDRCLSWQYEAQTVSIWSVEGRLRGISFQGNPEHLDLLGAMRQGESDLVLRDGQFYLMATLDIAEPALDLVKEMLGVDLGIVQIAALYNQSTRESKSFCGKKLRQRRIKEQRLRSKLQKKGTKSAKRLLKLRSKKEARFIKDTNHCIAKQIVSEAKRTETGIAIEELTGIRERVRLRKPQRTELHGWSFDQLAFFLIYKAIQAGVPLFQVDPAYTSQTCSGCGHRARSNRVNQARFCCRSCGMQVERRHQCGHQHLPTWTTDVGPRGAVTRPDAA